MVAGITSVMEQSLLAHRTTQHKVDVARKKIRSTGTV
jgi:hypothetical protein